MTLIMDFLTHLTGLMFKIHASHICNSSERPLALYLNILTLHAATTAPPDAGLNPDNKGQ